MIYIYSVIFNCILNCTRGKGEKEEDEKGRKEENIINGLFHVLLITYLVDKYHGIEEAFINRERCRAFAPEVVCCVCVPVPCPD